MTLNVSYVNDLEVKSDRTQIDRAFFNRRFKTLFDELVRLDAEFASFGNTENTLVQLGLERLNETLGPLLAELQAAAQYGFMWAKSVGTNISLVLGEAEGFFVTENAALFVPTPVMWVQDMTDPLNWGLVTLDVEGWHAETGDLATHCIFANKTQSSSQWFISDSAAIFPAMQDLLAQCTTARDATAASAATVAASMATLASAITAIETGPVSSVAGKTGAVLLNENDVSGLISDLAAKASISSVSSQVASKQDVSAKLTTLAATAWAANKLLMFTSASAFLGLDISAFMQTLLASADQAAARTALGAVAPSDIPALPVKASSAEVAAGTDDAKFATAAGIAATYSSKTMPWAAAQAAGFTLGATFNGQAIPWTNASAGTVTLANAAPAGTECLIVCEGAGQITFAAQAGGFVHSRGNRLKSNGQYSMITAVVRSNAGTNADWRLGGDLSL